MRLSWSCVLAALVVVIVVAASCPAQAQRAVGRCPQVVTVYVQRYYVPAPAQVAVPASTPRTLPPTPTYAVGHQQPTIIIVLPQSPPPPSPFGARYDKDGRLVAISTPQFIGAPSPGFLNSRFRFDENGRLIQISTPQMLPAGSSAIGRPPMLGRQFGRPSFSETSSFGGTFRGGLRLPSIFE